MDVKIVPLFDYPQYVPEVIELAKKEWSGLFPTKKDYEWVYLNNEKIPLTYVALDFSQDLPKLVGTFCIRINDYGMYEELSPWLSYVVVPEEYRGQGIGKLMVNFSLEEAKKFGVANLYLFTEKAQDLYSRYGWKAVESFEYMGTEITLMSISLQTIKEDCLIGS